MHGKKGNLGIQKFRDSGITENKDSPVGAAFSRDSNTSYDLNGFNGFNDFPFPAYRLSFTI